MREHWQAAFLSALTRTGNVRISCGLAGIDPTTAYYHKRRYPAFKAAWNTALEGHADLRAGRAKSHMAANLASIG